MCSKACFRKGMMSHQPLMSIHGFKSASMHAGLVDSSGFDCVFFPENVLAGAQKGL